MGWVDHVGRVRPLKSTILGDGSASAYGTGTDDIIPGTHHLYVNSICRASGIRLGEAIVSLALVRRRQLHCSGGQCLEKVGKPCTTYSSTF